MSTNVVVHVLGVTIVLAATSPSSAQQDGSFGYYDDYGGNISAAMGRGVGYIQSKRPFHLHEEDSEIKGYRFVVRWEWPHAQEPHHSHEEYTAICWSNFDDLSVFSDDHEEWTAIDLNNPPGNFTSTAFYYDLWHTVCENNAGIY